MYNAMKKFILIKFYETAKEIQDRLNVFYAANRLAVEQYSELTELATDIYK